MTTACTSALCNHECSRDPFCQLFTFETAGTKCILYRQGCIQSAIDIPAGIQIFIPGTFVAPTTVDTACSHEKEYGFDLAKVKECRDATTATCNAITGCHIPCVDDSSFSPTDNS